jgi:hypothetical protein
MIWLVAGRVGFQGISAPSRMALRFSGRECQMGLMSLLERFAREKVVFIDKTVSLYRYRLLEDWLAEHKASGLDDVEASALLIVRYWNLPRTPEIGSRAIVMAKNLKEPKWVIGLLMFAQMLGVGRAMSRSFAADPFFVRHGQLYATTIPLTDFSRKYMKRIWNKQYVKPVTVRYTAFAAFYTTMICPFDVSAWLILAELRKMGMSLEVDGRDHATEGIANGEDFLARFPDADPEFRVLLTEGIKHLRQAGKERVAFDAAMEVLHQHLGPDAQRKL